MPATSANVTLIVAGSMRRALERPKLLSAPMPPPLLAARRANTTNSPTISSVGPNPSRIERISGVVLVVDWALTWTRCDLSRAVNWSWFQNVGTWVANSVVGLAVASALGYRTDALNLPSMVSPLDAIDATRPDCTAEMKYGLNGTFTRSWPLGENSSTEPRLNASSA